MARFGNESHILQSWRTYRHQRRTYVQSDATVYTHNQSVPSWACSWNHWKCKNIWNSCVSCHSLPLIVPWSPWSGVNISQNYMNNFLSELTRLFVTWIPVVFSLLCAFLRGWTYKVPFLFDLLHGASVRYLIFPLTRPFLHNLPIVYISLLRSLWLITLCIRCFSTIKIRRSHFQPYTFLQSELPPYVFSPSEFHISLCFTWRYTLSLLSLTHTWLSTTHTFELL